MSREQFPFTPASKASAVISMVGGVLGYVFGFYLLAEALLTKDSPLLWFSIVMLGIVTIMSSFYRLTQGSKDDETE